MPLQSVVKMQSRSTVSPSEGKNASHQTAIAMQDQFAKQDVRYLWLMIVLSAMLTVALLTFTSAIAFAQESPCSQVCYASPTGNDSNAGNAASPKLTIQAAVNQVNPGGLVYVLEGVYAEQVSINKNLTLVGDSATKSIIRPTSVAANTTTLVGGTTPVAAIVLIDAANLIEIRNLQIDGAAAAASGAVSGCTAGYVGLYLRDASAQLQSIDTRNMQISGNATCDKAAGVLVQSADLADSVSITRSRITGNSVGFASNSPAIVAINRSNLSSNILFGVNNSAAASVNAECNWFGAAGGPNGGGSSVNGTVDFDPFLTTASLETPCTVTAVPSVSIISSLIVQENVVGGIAAFNVTITPAASDSVTVPFTIADGSALIGSDYLTPTAPIVFFPGETLKTINVQIVDDAVIEQNESFNITLGAAQNAVVGNATSTGVIIDNDENIIITPTVSINAISVDEGAGQASFEVGLNVASSRAVTMNFGTSDGNALAGVDYEAKIGQLVIPAGLVNGTINITVKEDSELEGNEAFNLALSGLQNAIQGASLIGIATILDNEITPTLSIDNVNISEDAGQALFTIALNVASSRPVTVDYETADETATGVFDYAVKSGKIVIPAGSLHGIINIPVIDDSNGEASETFLVKLANPQLAELGKNNVGKGTIVDNDSLPVLSLSPENITVNEGVTKVDFVLSLSAASSNEVSFNYATGNGSATGGSDFTASSGKIVFAAGSRFKTLSIPILEDTNNEGDEGFSVSLSSLQGATPGNLRSNVTIQDNDIVGGKVTIKLNLVGNTLADGPNHFFEGTLGSFTLDNGSEYPAAQTFNSPTGQRVIRYVGNTSDYFLTAISCSNEQPTNLASGVVTLTVSAGVEVICTYTSERSVAIRSQVYNDLNGNHNRETGELGMSGWLVSITNLATGQSKTKTTSTLGHASFTKLAPGNYKVCETVQAGYTNTQPTGSESCYTIVLAPGETAQPIFGNVLGAGDGGTNAGKVLRYFEAEIASELESGVKPPTDEWDLVERTTPNELKVFLPTVYK